MRRLRLLRPLALAAVAAVLLAALSGSAVSARARDGIEVVIDRRDGSLRVRDPRTGEDGPTLRVVTGSPAHPTPRGVFTAWRVILRPGWTPSDAAREAGAERERSSLDTPMGVAKIPFAEGGSVALHGGGEPLLLGKPVSSGCVRARDADLLRLLAWLHGRGVLGPPHERPDGEVERPFLRPVTIAVR